MDWCCGSHFYTFIACCEVKCHQGIRRNPVLIIILITSPSDRSLSAGWVGLVGRRGPRSKQPFMVTFFRASQAPCRPPRALPRNNPRKNKKTKYILPHPNRPGMFGELTHRNHGECSGKPQMGWSFVWLMVVTFLCTDQIPSSGRQACKRHELYVSFSDLGWKVSFLTNMASTHIWTYYFVVWSRPSISL